MKKTVKFLVLLFIVTSFFSSYKSTAQNSINEPKSEVELLVQYLETNGDFINTKATALILADEIKENLKNKKASPSKRLPGVSFWCRPSESMENTVIFNITNTGSTECACIYIDTPTLTVTTNNTIPIKVLSITTQTNKLHTLFIAYTAPKANNVSYLIAQTRA